MHLPGGQPPDPPRYLVDTKGGGRDIPDLIDELCPLILIACHHLDNATEVFDQKNNLVDPCPYYR